MNSNAARGARVHTPEIYYSNYDCKVPRRGPRAAGAARTSHVLPRALGGAGLHAFFYVLMYESTSSIGEL